MAAWAGESISARQLCNFQQRTRVLQAAPAIEQHENGDGCEKDIANPNREANKSNDSHEPENSRNQQAARTAQNEPQQATKNLSAVEWVDGQHIEY